MLAEVSGDLKRANQELDILRSVRKDREELVAKISQVGETSARELTMMKQTQTEQATALAKNTVDQYTERLAEMQASAKTDIANTVANQLRDDVMPQLMRAVDAKAKRLVLSLAKHVESFSSETEAIMSGSVLPANTAAHRTASTAASTSGLNIDKDHTNIATGYVTNTETRSIPLSSSRVPSYFVQSSTASPPASLVGSQAVRSVDEGSTSFTAATRDSAAIDSSVVESSIASVFESAPEAPSEGAHDFRSEADSKTDDASITAPVPDPAAAEDVTQTFPTGEVLGSREVPLSNSLAEDRQRTFEDESVEIDDTVEPVEQALAEFRAAVEEAKKTSHFEESTPIEATEPAEEPFFRKPPETLKQTEQETEPEAEEREHPEQEAAPAPVEEAVVIDSEEVEEVLKSEEDAQVPGGSEVVDDQVIEEPESEPAVVDEPVEKEEVEPVEAIIKDAAADTADIAKPEAIVAEEEAATSETTRELNVVALAEADAVIESAAVTEETVVAEAIVPKEAVAAPAHGAEEVESKDSVVELKEEPEAPEAPTVPVDSAVVDATEATVAEDVTTEDAREVGDVETTVPLTEATPVEEHVEELLRNLKFCKL